jgi:transglutaminase-like putative cysteine protease
VHRQLVRARWLVQVPAGRALAVDVRGPVRHEVRREGSHDVHVFTAADVPPLVPEPSMPPARDLLATVTLSTLTDWREYVEWERALLREVFESNAELRQLAARLVDGTSSPRERLERIYHYVAREIRYQQDYETTIAGVRPHSCPVVLERGYGDCKDKAVLMILLAREAGLELRFAILRTTTAGRVLRDVPNQQFNHAIVYVPAQEGIGEGFFMDPTTDGLDVGNLREDDQGATALVIDPNGGRFEFLDIPFQESGHQYLRCAVDVRIASSDAAHAEARCTARGSDAAGVRRTVRNAERARQLYQGFANMIFSGATVTRASSRNADDIWRPVELELGLDASAALQPRGGEHRMPIPSSFPLAHATRLEARRLPLRLGPPDSQRWQITYELPPGGRIVRAPENFDVTHACFRVSRSTVVRGRRATVAIEYERSCPEIAPEHYAELRRLAQRAWNQLQTEMVFDLRRVRARSSARAPLLTSAP